MAKFLKDCIGSAFPKHKIFVSSDPGDLKLADEWVLKILKALESAKFVLVLATERGLSRKWVWFEAGRTWFSGVKMLPCCVGTLRKSDLPSPFSGRMGANLDEPKDVQLLFEFLRGLFGELAETPDWEQFATTMTRLDIRAEERQKIQNDPFATERIQDIERQMQRLSPVDKETIRQFVMCGELTAGAVWSKVKDSGADMERWLVPDRLVEITGWLNPMPGNTAWDDMQRNAYRINPEMRPLLQDYFSRQK
jgi:hypothetical protein